jgi:predicted double-glycine peptidase
LRRIATPSHFSTPADNLSAFLSVTPWLETIGVILLAVAASFAGHRLSQLSRGYWISAYAICALLIFAIWLGRSYSALSLTPPISWIAGGRTKFALVAVLPIVLLLPLFRLNGHPRVRFFGWAFLVVFVGIYAVWPFAGSAANRCYLASLPTRFDRDGICLQSTDYTCGPAAAVTALKHLGIRADEGAIAIAAHSSSAIGTPPDMLRDALLQLYSTNGLDCELRYFSQLSDLPKGQPTMAVIKYSFLEDHYVVILGITKRFVLVADSNRGRIAYSHEAFMKRWRKLGIVLSRAS